MRWRKPIVVAAAFSMCGFVGFAQVLDVLNFDSTSEGPWSDIDNTTLTVPLVTDGSVTIDGKPSSAEYGGFKGVNVVPGDNGWILDFPGDRSWDGPEDSSFTFWLAQDETYLYVGVDVKDDVVNSDDPNVDFWKDDSIEIVVDALNDRFDNNTDKSADPFGGHHYVNFQGRFSDWDEDAKTKAASRNRWSTAVDWTFGPDGDIYGIGAAVKGGWQMEVRYAKRLFEDPDAGNKLTDGFVMGFNIGLDDDDKRGPGPQGSGERSQDLELQYFWANRARLLGFDADSALDFTLEELKNGVQNDFFDRGISSGGRLSHGGTGEIVFTSELSAPIPANLGISIAGGKVTLQWEGGRALESTSQITGPWTVVDGATSPFTVQATGSTLFFRVP